MNETNISLMPRSVEGSVILEHLVLNVLSRISALVEMDVIQSQNLVVALGKYIHVSSSVFRAARFPFYGDIEEIFSGLKLLGLMRNVVIDVGLASDGNLQEVPRSYSVFRDFYKWFDANFLVKNVSNEYNVSIVLLRDAEDFKVKISVCWNGQVETDDAVWNGMLEAC